MQEEKSKSGPVKLSSLMKNLVAIKYSTKRIRYLLQVKWVRLLIVMQEGWTALHYAADRGHVDVLHVLLMVEQCHVSMCNKVSHKKSNKPLPFCVSGDSINCFMYTIILYRGTIDGKFLTNWQKLQLMNFKICYYCLCYIRLLITSLSLRDQRDIYLKTCH